MTLVQNRQQLSSGNKEFQYQSQKSISIAIKKLIFCFYIDFENTIFIGKQIIFSTIVMTFELLFKLPLPLNFKILEI